MATNPPSDEFEQQLINQLIVESPNLDQTLGAVMKNVVSAGRQNEFISALSAFGNRKEKEIEKVCSQNYQHFSKSIDELLAIRRDASELKNAAIHVLEEIGQCGQLLYDTRVEMHETRKMVEHTQKLVSSLEDCLRALNCAQQASLEIIDKNHGRALRLMEQLQSELLPQIELFSFSARLQEWLPVQLESIRTAALDDLKLWLGSVRVQTQILGEQAFHRAQKRIDRWREMHKGISTPTAIQASPVDDNLSAVAYADLVEMEREDAASIIFSPPVQIDFAPLLHAVHLFDLMNRRPEFQVMFADYRRAQAKVIFDAPVNLKDGEGKSFTAFLQSICGFFIIEYFLTRKPQKFYSQAHVEGLWETAVRIINNYIMESLGDHADQGMFMKIKWLQVFFLHSIEIYDIYSITPMLDTILSLFYRYVDLAKAERLQAIQTSAQNATFCRIETSNPKILTKWTRQFSFLTDDTDDTKGGAIDGERYLPFSSFLGDVFGNINDFINNFYIFLEGIPQQSSELDDIAKKSCDWLLEQSVKIYVERLQAGNVGVEGTIQVIKDLECIQKIQPDIARILISKAQVQRTSLVKMSCNEAINGAIHEAQEHLFALVNQDLKKALGQSKYDPYPSVTPINTSDINDIFISRYHQTMQIMEGARLDSETIKQLKFNMFGQMAEFVHDFLNNSGVTAINLNFVIQLDLDFKALAREAENPLLLESFAELRQLVELMMVEQPHEYLDPVLRNRKYPNLKPSDIIPVLQKLKEPASKRRNVEDMILLLK